MVAPHDAGMMKEMEAIENLNSIPLSSLEDPLIEVLSTALDQDYLQAIGSLQCFQQEDKAQGSSLKIVYTSLHGTGITLIPKALREWGFSNVHLVDSQVCIDGDFPTVPSPNPESTEALGKSIELLKEIGADIALATDPDADRIRVVANHRGIPIPISGNQMAAICTDFLCQVLPQLNRMPSNGAFVTTLVTTELLKKIAEANQIHCFEVLTGFKYIGEKIHHFETLSPGYQFVFGAEESCGYLFGTHARDKDAIISACLIAEIALFAKMQNQTLIDRLHHIYKTYGIYREKQRVLNFPHGKEGRLQMAEVMQSLRLHPPCAINGLKAICVKDYLKETCTDPLCSMPASDVLLFCLEDQTRLVIRPSGTEPKIKIYGSATTKNFASVEEGIQKCDEHLDSCMEMLNRRLASFISLPLPKKSLFS